MTIGLVEAAGQMLEEAGLLEREKHMLCAVSGGPDSMALLHVLHRLSQRHSFALTAAHMNHRFRVEESQREAEMVGAYCSRLGVPLVYREADVPAYVRDSGDNAQAAARELRYRFLTEAADACGAGTVVLAHHADDQAETVLMNVVRGSGLSGLSGMPQQRKLGKLELVRPFLRINKQELVSFCREYAVPYAVDSSNLERKYTRNRIRLDVMPHLLELNPRLAQSLHRLADIVREEDALLEQLCIERAPDIVAFSEAGCSLSRERFIAEPTALQRRLIKLILNYVAGDTYFPDFSIIEAIRSAIKGESPPSLALDAGCGIRLKRTYDNIVIKAEAEAGKPARTVESADEEARNRVSIEIEDEPLRRRPSGRNEALFDAEGVRFPLTVRVRRDGDRIELFGLNGSKKVKDMFIDLKIAPKLRDCIPIVVDGEGRLLWIAGVRRSRHAPVTETTRRIVRVVYEPEEPRRETPQS